eukprot:5058811-Prymnesium_polylepis.1
MPGSSALRRLAAVVVAAAVVDAYPRNDGSIALLQQPPGDSQTAAEPSQALSPSSPPSADVPLPTTRAKAALSAIDQASCARWKGKGGDDTRAGHSVTHSGPRELVKPTWTYPTGYANYQSPVVDCSGNVYIGTHSGTVTKLSSYGDVQWSVEIFPTSLATPALEYDADGKLVIYITPLIGRWAFGLDASNGDLLLNVTYGSASGQKDGWSVGAAAGVLVASGRAADAPLSKAQHSAASVFALDASTGSTLWSFSEFEGAASLERGSGGPYNFMPVIAVDDTPGPTLMYETQNGAVVKHDLRTGAVLWRIASPSNESFSTAGCAMASAGAQRPML